AGGRQAVLGQAAEHIGEPLLRASRMAVGREVVWPLGETRQQCAFFQRELLYRLAEIAARCKLDAPGAASEIDGIEIQLENFRLAQGVLQPRRNNHLADLALIG